ncbi:DUF1648 domain-containing protein [Streptomyces sp. NPDC002004]
MIKHRAGLAGLAVLPFLVALVCDLALFVHLRGRLPDPLATHFTGSAGIADGYAGRGSFPWVCSASLLGLSALFGAIGAIGVSRRPGPWPLVLGYATAGLLGSVFASVLVVNSDVSQGTDARLPMWHVGAALGVAAVAAVAVLPVARRLSARMSTGPHEPAADRASLNLADGELAGWAGRTGSRPVGALGAALVAAACVLLRYTGWPAFASLLLAGLLCMAFTRLQVTAGAQGLTVAPALLAWPRIHVPLDRMTEASHREISALRDFGGWGYRVRAGASGVILHSGDALFVRRGDGREFAVTVEDAATAAALLNALIDRRKGH